MEKNLTNQTIALAGLTQAVALVKQIARHGDADQSDMETCVASILKIDADNIMDVYGGGVGGLSKGLRLLDQQLSEPRQVDPEMARYASSLIFLEHSLMHRPEMKDTIGVAIQKAQNIFESSGQLLNESLFEALSYGYQQTISQLKPRVIVSGEQRYLNDRFNADRIRTLLLAGIRSAVLWQQAGGVRWKLLFFRSRVQREARRLLA